MKTKECEDYKAHRERIKSEHQSQLFNQKLDVYTILIFHKILIYKKKTKKSERKINELEREIIKYKTDKQSSTAQNQAQNPSVDILKKVFLKFRIENHSLSSKILELLEGLS